MAIRNYMNKYARSYFSGPTITMTYYFTVRTDSSDADDYEQ